MIKRELKIEEPQKLNTKKRKFEECFDKVLFNYF